MSNYQDEHNINESSEREDQVTSPTTSPHSRHPTLNQALEQFLYRHQTNPYDEETRQLVNSMMSYVVPDAENSTDLFQTMLNSLLSSPDTMMVLGGESKGKDGVDNEFLDTLDRVSLKELPKGSRCPICTNDFRSGEYPLVVRLPCDSRHCFDLECISPWLKMNRTCPLCREDVTEVRQKKLEGLVRKAKEEGGEEDEEEGWEMYG